MEPVEKLLQAERMLCYTSGVFTEEKKGIEDVKIYKTLIVKGFGCYESVWTLFNSVDSHLNLCPGKDQTDRLFCPRAGNCQSFYVLKKEIQDSEMTCFFFFFFGIQVLWPNKNMKKILKIISHQGRKYISKPQCYHYPPTRMTVLKKDRW